jgi:tetratricopeptide (TPR) repeat protein
LTYENDENNDGGSDVDLEAAMGRVKQLAEDGRAADAVALCTQLIQRFKGEFEPYFRRAQAHWRLGDGAAAIRDLTDAIELRPDEPALYYFRGLWNIETGAPLQGTADLGEAIARDRKLGSTYYADCAPLDQAIGYLMLGKFELAQSSVDALPREMKTFVAGQLWTGARVREFIAGRRKP